MTDTTRGLIQRLANALHDAAEDVGCWGSYASGYFQEKHDLPGNIAKIHAQAEEARAYLAQPEPEGPTDEELEEFALKHGGGYFNCDCQAEADILTRKHVSNYRAVLARWGRPTTTTQEDN